MEWVAASDVLHFCDSVVFVSMFSNFPPLGSFKAVGRWFNVFVQLCVCVRERGRGRGRGRGRECKSMSVCVCVCVRERE